MRVIRLWKCLLWCGALVLLWQAPAWPLESQPFIKKSFLNLKEDLVEANKAGRLLMVIFEQDGCSYCQQMHRVNFHDAGTVDLLKAHFDVVQLDIWGGRDVADFSGASMTEKRLARKLRVEFSPTLVFYDATGQEIYRVAGLHKTAVFKAELEYLASRAYLRMKYSEHAARQARTGDSAQLADMPFLAPAYDLAALSKKAWARDKVLGLWFVETQCAECREMQEQYFTRPDTIGLLTRHFEVARLDAQGASVVTDLSGERLSESALARKLGVQRTPVLVFFDRSGEEILRYEKYLTPETFTNGLLTFLATHAYRRYDTLQDWLRHAYQPGAANE